MKQLLLWLCLSAGQVASSQKIPTTTFDLTDVEAEKNVPIPFSGITVIDARFDQSNIGSIHHIRKANANKLKYEQTIASFPDSLRLYLPQILHKFCMLEKESKNNLVLLVKQFRLTDRLENGINRQFEPELLLRLSISAFCQKGDQLSRLFSVDELISKKLPSDKIPKDEVMSGYFKDALMEILQQVFAKQTWQEKGTGFALYDVQQGLQKRFQLPLFTDTVMRIGIYKTFQEFKQNSPSLTNVRVKMKKNDLQAITDSAGTELDLSDFWGACDGKKRYIIFRNDLYELSPSDKSFSFSSFIRRGELAGRPGFVNYAPQGGLLTTALMRASENKEIAYQFYLNMDEGTIYLEDIFGKSSLKQLEKELLK